MDKNKIKSYAVWARRAMIEAVKDRAFKVGIEENKIHDIERLQGGFKVAGREEIFNIPSTHRDTLVKLINEKGYEQVIEEVAYTWFNRFMGLRFMEVNDYLPTGVRILSSEDEGKTEPDVLSKVNDIEDELNLNLDYVYELQDKGTEQAREELYKYILIKQCNELGKIIPQMFEKIQDYTELLFPDNLLVEGSVIRKMVTDIDEEDWKEEVEIIGWMYQYYIFEKKQKIDESIAEGGKVSKDNLPCKTQIFTPEWVVRYLVDNSIGALWNESKDNNKIKLKYYLDNSRDYCLDSKFELINPKDIKIIDPCMGSGHILSYAFDVLMKIYLECGYSEREIPLIILKNNLYGLDIDDRAAQLAIFQLIMKSRRHNRRLFRELERNKIEINLTSIKESNSIIEDIDQIVDLLYKGKYTKKEKENLLNLLLLFENAKEYGSLINTNKIDIEEIKSKIKLFEENQDVDLYLMSQRLTSLEKLKDIVKQTEILSIKYDCTITNPPYLGNGAMNINLQEFLNKNYKDTKSDLFAVFIMRGFELLKETGINAQVTMQSWMTLSSYNKFRKYIVDNKTISSLVHMGNGVMGIAFGTSATIFRNNNLVDYEGEFIKIDMSDIENDEPKQFPVFNHRYSKSRMSKFRNLPDNYIAYWISNKIENIFEENKSISEYAKPRQGLATGDNERFLRLWFEIDINKIGFNFSNRKSAAESKNKWFPCNKGGSYRKWYGNNEYVVNWENDGYEIRNFKNNNGKLRSRPQNMDYYFKEGITWSTLTSKALSMRYTPKGFLFETKGSMLFGENENISKNILGVMNGVVGNKLIQIVSPTMDFHEGPMGKIPMIFSEEESISLIDKCINISKKEWDSFEVSWDFKVHPLLKLSDENKEFILNKRFMIWKEECEEEFEMLKNNEEELNRIFIDIYGLQDELTPEVEDKDITIRKADRERDIKSFISYAVGCMFGRYSIDVEGLIYAGGDFNDKWKVTNDKWQVRKLEKDEEGNIISDSWVDSTFIPDIDNIIPITEDEYFEDDIVSRFIEFLKVVYGADTLEENLDFIAESLGVKANETSRQTIRRYFLKEFYKDHLKVYQKRPIYWMFDSGKNDGFKALVYMHRYNESTVAKLRTDYLHSLQRKYEAEILRLQAVAESTTLSAREKTQAKKNIDKINKKIEECKLYDQVVAHVANERISIDLDDGVKHNYGLFQGIKVPTDSGKEVKMDLLAKI